MRDLVTTFHRKLEAKLNAVLDDLDPEVVDQLIRVLRKFETVERMYLGEWLAQVKAEREEAARAELEAARA